VLEAARSANPKNPELLLAAVRLERRAGNAKQATTLLSAALKDCPGSGRLIADDIDAAPRHERKRKAVDALTKHDTDPHVNLAVARLFAAERKADKARKFFSRATTLDKDFGDAWASAYAFELDLAGSAATTPEAAAIEAACVAAEPKHGEVWQRVAKAAASRGFGTRDVLLKTAQTLRALAAAARTRED
jgi:pre-mRNA-processing factor 6